MSLAAEGVRLSILVVDDEAPVRDLLGWLLEDSGHSIHAAADAYEALALLRAEKPFDLVVSDINMPGMDGVMLSRRIETEFPALPVLLTSGRPRPDGVRAFIAKPFRIETLTEEIAKLAWSSRRCRHESRAAALASSLLRLGLSSNLLDAERAVLAERPNEAPHDLTYAVLARMDDPGDPAAHLGD